MFTNQSLWHGLSVRHLQGFCPFPPQIQKSISAWRIFSTSQCLGHLLTAAQSLSTLTFSWHLHHHLAAALCLVRSALQKLFILLFAWQCILFFFIFCFPFLHFLLKYLAASLCKFNCYEFSAVSEGMFPCLSGQSPSPVVGSVEDDSNCMSFAQVCSFSISIIN